MTDTLTDLLEENARLREHSVMLNSIAWSMALALGDAKIGQVEHYGDPREQADRLIVAYRKQRAALQSIVNVLGPDEILWDGPFDEGLFVEAADALKTAKDALK